MQAPTDTDLRGDPVLVVGWRPRAKHLEARTVDLRTDVHQIAREIASTTLEAIARRERLPWHPDAHIETGEQYLALPAAELPTAGAVASPDQHADAQESSADSQLSETAALLRLVLGPGRLENLHPSRLAQGRFRFYALVWEDGDSGRPIAFVSEYDPTTALQKASHFFRYDGTLRTTERPDFALNAQTELVVTERNILILNPHAFDRLFSDVRALMNDVPSYAEALRLNMTGLACSAGTLQALKAVCARLPSLARRLQRLAVSPHADKITPVTLSLVLQRHGLDPSDYLTEHGLELDPEQVRTFLDLAEGRWYEADFTEEPRRAARWSTR